MSTNFPTSLDSLTNPVASSNTATLSHASQHSNANDAIEALQAKVGVDSSAVTTSLDYLVKNTSSSDPGHKHTLATGATDVTASAADLNATTNFEETVSATTSEVTIKTTKTLNVADDGGLKLNEVAVTSTAAELNILDGATLSTTELNYVDGVTSAIQTQLDGKVDENVAITGATKTKITYDAKGLVTSGADATTADIAASTDKNYVTDAQLTVIQNTSGTNTGDQDLSGLIPKSTVDAKGDLLVASADNTVTRLAVGTNNYLLTADSGEATGLKWAAAPTSVSVTTKGDLQTYDTAPARLPVGVDGKVLKANSATATGLEWGDAGSTSPLTTKGDVYTYSTTNDRLAVGANNTVLMADSTQSTGLKWAAASATSHITGETPSGTMNSSNVTFTLANTPITGTLKLYHNRTRLKETDDYTISGTTITLTVAPDSGDALLADYSISAGDFAVGSASWVSNETPSGLVNGSNTTYTLAAAPITGTLALYRDGQLLTGGGADYTLTTNSIAMTTAPVTGSVLLAFYQSSASVAGNADTVDGVHASDTFVSGSLIPDYGGWIKPPTVTLTYSSADDPTYVVATNTDLTAVIGVGFRVKFTNNSTTFYGIVTAITATTMTLYGGTDYDVANSAITNFYFSRDKSPIGFPLDPTKWTVALTDTSERTQASPSNGTVYNLGSLSVSFPIGVWDVSFSGGQYVGSGVITDQYGIGGYAGLSTANNSFSDNELKSTISASGYTSSYTMGIGAQFNIKKTLVLTSKTTYYLVASANFDTGQGIPTDLRFVGSNVTTKVRATCAYL